MANVSKTVEIIFGGKNELSSVINEVGRDLDSIAGKPDKFNLSLSSAAENVLKIDAAMAALAIGGLAYAVKQAGEFETSFDKVALRINASDSEINKFRGDVLDYGIDSTFSLGEINAALTESIQKGTNYKDAIAELATSEKLAVATHSDLKSSTVLLSTVMNAYGASMSEAAHYGDIFTKGVELGAGEIPQMADEMGKLSGIAAAMGIPIQTVVAAIAALGSYGIDTGTAIAGLKMMLNNLLAPSKEAQKEAANLNIQFDAQAVKTKGLAAVLQETYTATNGNAEAMKALFGSVKGLNVSMDLASDKQRICKNDLVATQNATGEMQREYDLFVNDFENVNQRLKNSFEVTLVDIGLKLMPDYAKIAVGMSHIMKGIKVGVDSGAFDPLFTYLDSVAVSVAKWLADVGAAFPEALKNVDFTGLVDALKNFGAAVDGLFDLGDDKPKAMAAAMQLVIDSVKYLVEVTKGILEVFAPLIRVSEDVVGGLTSLDTATKELIGNLMGLSLQYKLFGPVVTLVMQGIAADTESGARDVKLTFLVLENGINAIKVAVVALGLVFANVMLEIAENGKYLPLGLSAFAGSPEDIQRASDRVKILGDLLDGYENDLAASSMKVQAAWDGADVSAKKFTATVKATPTSVTTEGIFMPKLDPLATSETQWNLTQAFFLKDKNQIDLYTTLQNAEVLIAKDKLKEAFPPRWNMDVIVEADGTTIETTRDMIYKQFGDNSPGHESGDYLITNIGTRADEEKMAATKKALETAFPKEKPMEIQAQLDVAKIKADGEIVQKSIEWKAKLDIADVEANAKIVEAAFKSIDTTITSTGTTLSSMLATFAGLQGKGGTSFVEQQIIDEARRRDAALDMQKDLVGAEVDNLRARTDSLKRGDAIITINGAGLQPQLEAFMFAILAAVQVKANAEGQKFLVGI